jgi:transcriptional regulator with XRE-family HTH domain
MTQDELASLLSVSRSTVAMWETGQSYPLVEKLLQLSEIFKCTLDELIKKEDT